MASKVRLLLLGMLVALFVLGGYLAAWVVNLNNVNGGFLFFFLLVVILTSSLLGVIGAGLRWTSRALDWVHKWNHQARRRLALPHALPFPVLIIRDTSDEASSALGGAQFMSWLTTLGLRWSAGVLPNGGDTWQSSHWMGWLFRRCSALALFGLAIAILCAFPPPYEDWLSSIGLWLATGAALTFIGLVLLSLLTVPLIWLLIVALGLAMAPFGIRTAIGALSLQVSAEGSPPGFWNVFQMSSFSRELDAGGLRHSTYENPIALKRIHQWLAHITQAD